MMDIKELKAQIRSVLLSCGKTATEREFRNAFYELEGISFNEILRKVNLSFLELFMRMPDVAQVIYTRNQLFIQRVSSEETSHMDHLTINKYSKNYQGPRLVTSNGAILTNQPAIPLSINPYQYSMFRHPYPPIYQQMFHNQNPIMPMMYPVYHQMYSPNQYQARMMNPNMPVPNNQATFRPAKNIDQLKYQTNNINSTLSQKFHPTATSTSHNMEADNCQQNVPNVTQSTDKISIDNDVDASKLNPSTVVKVETPPEKPQKFCETTTIQDNVEPECPKSPKISNTIDFSQFLNPDFVRKRLRSMKLLREVLNKDQPKPEIQSIDKLIFGNELTALTLNEDQTFFDIKIIDVLNPSSFTFQFSFKKLKELENQMNQFYNSLDAIERKKYHFKDLVKGCIVAFCREDPWKSTNQWYRAHVLEYTEMDAYIQLVDFMKIGSEKVSRENIYHLHQKFTVEPQKSAMGRVFGVKPKKSENWNFLSVLPLIDIQDKVVLASVNSVKDKIYSLSVVLTEDPFISATSSLIDSGVAEINQSDLSAAICYYSLASI